MNHWSKRFMVVNLFILWVSAIAWAQRIPERDTTDNKVKIYLDCSDCDFSYFRRNIHGVDFVREPKLAGVHVLVTKQSTASRGTEYNIHFIGKGSYAGLQYKLQTIASREEKAINRWERLAKVINMGLLPYVAGTPEKNNITIQHTEQPKDPGENNVLLEEEKDPWNYWYFRIGTDADIEGEESEREIELGSYFNAERITNQTKFRSSVYYNLERDVYFDDGDRIESQRDSKGFDAEWIYSLNAKWSTGVFSEISTSSYYNMDLETSTGPAIEYNIFPWDASDRKVFTLGYYLKTNYYQYHEVTLFDKKEELRQSQALKLTLILRNPWGEIESYVTGSHYFYDFSKNKLSFNTDVSVNVTRGLSLYTEIQAQLIHDQLYLPAGEATREELILRKRKLKTAYQFDVEFGIRYNFGSIYNNIVNPRL